MTRYLATSDMGMAPNIFISSRKKTEEGLFIFLLRLK